VERRCGRGGGRGGGGGGADRRRAVERQVERVDLRRRVAVARTLAADPEFILYDEPTAGLDPITGRKIAHLMRDLDTKLKSTSIVVTHDIECARIVSSRWVYLSRGQVLADGSPEQFFASSEAEVREFLLVEEKAQKLPHSTAPGTHLSGKEP